MRLHPEERGIPAKSLGRSSEAIAADSADSKRDFSLLIYLGLPLPATLLGGIGSCCPNVCCAVLGRDNYYCYLRILI